MSPETSPSPRHFPPIAPISSPCLNKFYRSPIVSITKAIPFQFIYMYIYFFFIYFFRNRKEGRNDVVNVVISFSLNGNDHGFSLLLTRLRRIIRNNSIRKNSVAIDDLSRLQKPFCSAQGMFTSGPFFRASARAKIHFPRSHRPVSRAAKAAARYFFEITRQPVGLNASRDSFTRFECPLRIQSCFSLSNPSSSLRAFPFLDRSIIASSSAKVIQDNSFGRSSTWQIHYILL